MKLLDVYPLFDITPVRAKDVFVYDQEGNTYLDLYGGHAVISIGHSHPTYVNALTEQLNTIGFYSNAVKNPLQEALAKKLALMSNCTNHHLFLCNSGAEANENALKLASFHTQNKKIIAFKNSFHGRTSAAVATTDNAKIIAPINAQHDVALIDLGDLKAVEAVLKEGAVAAVIIECIQGVGGLDEAPTSFYTTLQELCKKYNALLIADEVQSGFGRTGDFFAFQKHGLNPDIITMAKGMGNGFPIGGILVKDTIPVTHGMLGTTFGGNHLACAASLAVLEVLEKEHILQHVSEMATYFTTLAKTIPEIKNIKGRGLMLGLEFNFPIAALRKQLIFKQHMFTGSAKNPNLLRILPPLSIKKEHLDAFFNALKKELPYEKVY